MDSVKNSKVTGNGVTKVGAQGVAATSGTQAQDKGKGLTLQIGDTSAAYNQLKVSIKDCHVDALNLTDMKISDQESAGKALDMIKNAINYVSDVRGTLEPPRTAWTTPSTTCPSCRRTSRTLSPPSATPTWPTR